MNTVNARISSKNQLTLPMALVRKYKLDLNRNVIIGEKNGVITIKPEPTIQSVMQPFWDEFARTHPNFTPPTDAEISAETRNTYREHYNRDIS